MRIHIPKIMAIVLSMILTVSIASVFTPEARATHVSCGEVLISDTTLDGDVGPCPSGGFIIGADGITLDCAGFTIFAVSSGSAGITATGRSGVTIRNCTVNGFFHGIDLFSSNGNALENNAVTNNGELGFLLRSSNENVLQGNIADDSKEGGGFLSGGFVLDLSHDTSSTPNAWEENICGTQSGSDITPCFPG